MTTLWSASAVALALLGSGGIGFVLKTLLEHKRARRSQTDEVALSLVGTLTERVDKLEKALDAERRKCEAEMRVLRHRIANQRQQIYSLLHLFDLPANQRKAALARFGDELAALEKAEAAEKAALINT